MGNRAPFSLYEKNLKSGSFWYARFYDSATEKYSLSRATGVLVKGRYKGRAEAERVAWQILNELERQKTPFLIPYLESFWREGSKYARQKRNDGKPLSAFYIKANQMGIKLHIKSYKPFAKIRLSELKAGQIEDWKDWALNFNRTSPRRVNACLNLMRVAVREASRRGDIDNQPFARIIRNVVYESKEKGILAQCEVEKLKVIDDIDSRAKAAVLLAVLAGLRRGEARGLKWKDIDFENQQLDIHNNYVDSEGLKGCKADSKRLMFLHSDLTPVLHQVFQESPYTDPDDFVLFNLESRGTPCSVGTIGNGFKRILKNIEILPDDQKERNLTFHGLRHTFVTLARFSGIPDIEVQAFTGHKTTEMMNHYSHAAQVIDFGAARRRMETGKLPEADRQAVRDK
jgi:integrase